MGQPRLFEEREKGEERAKEPVPENPTVGSRLLAIGGVRFIVVGGVLKNFRYPLSFQ